MKTAPLVPAACSGDLHRNTGPAQQPGTSLASTLQDCDATAQQRAHQVLMRGADLPARWQGRSRFVLLETGFEMAHNFLRTWQAWRADPQRCERLCFVVVEPQPPSGPDLKRLHQGGTLWPLAEQLVRAWPPPTPNVHSLFFEAGHVQLLLAWGELRNLLPALQLRVDTFFVLPTACDLTTDLGFQRLAKALGRKATLGAPLVARGPAPGIEAALISAGFECRPAPLLHDPGTRGADGVTGSAISSHAQADAHTITLARYAPRFAVHSGARTATTPPRTAVVVGAGLAGAAAARALAQQGLQVTVLEARAAPASQGSGNAAGLFHGTVNGDDGHYARIFRAAALAAAREYALALQHRATLDEAKGTEPVSGQIKGLLRLDLRPGGLPAMQALVQRQHWPADYVQALSAADAAAMAGLPLPAPAWFYPAGGWINPGQWVRFALRTPGVHLRVHSRVHALRRHAAGWQVAVENPAAEPANPQWLQADVVVLAHTQAADALLQTLGHAPLPLSHTGGQVTHLAHHAGATLRLPVAGDGYALPLPYQKDNATQPGLLCGATRHDGQPGTDDLPAVTAQDHHLNLARLNRLLGLETLFDPVNASALQGRAAWRLNSSDRLPIAGAVPCVRMPPGQRMDQARLLPREQGLFVLTALGARGLTLAPLLAQLVAAQACGAPWPLEQDLVDALDPARWRVRAARRARQANPN